MNVASENGNQLCYHHGIEKLRHTISCVYQTARLWAPSYYVGTAGHVSAETIRKYIEAQETPGAK
jgi:REP element-mobilizing transposase RayT